MLKSVFRPLMAAMIVVGSSAAFTVSAADDPSLHAIYEAANSGKLAAAQDMIDTVLKDHPDSGKAHYVAAELDARQGKLAAARQQLQSAEKLAPGLPFAKPESVQHLRAQLGAAGSASSGNAGNSGGGLAALTPRPLAAAPVRSGPSPGFLIGIIAVVGFIAWMIFRRRPAPQYPQGYPANGGGYAGPGGVAGYPQQGAPGGGIGSGIAGGLASGLAVGAGVVAGEALAHRFMDGGERERYADGLSERPVADPNGNMGGNDFGISDSSSWDDSGGVSDSGGGDDWS